ncbi:Macrolide export ATP-binding/permease protein MacB [bioreactor metagenome]|uniref:Macrolide export ATP-binding/permease protein MacB n=1 Tax=bioreactor metagenome TaxID=1076179 RepID=A0A645ANW1_9ZZZZ
MNLGQAIIEALESLNSNKLRSTLTILGIVIGVGAVIAMLAVGTGAQSTITGSINGIGSNLVFVISGNSTSEVRNVKNIDMEDAQALLDQYQAPSVEAIAPIVSGSLEVSSSGEKTTATVDGVTADYETVRSADLTEGSFITDDNLLGRASVAIIGVDVADKLFDRREGLVGESIRISGQPFRIIGVLASKGGSSFGSQDNVVLVPLTTAQVRLYNKSSNEIDMLMVEATSASTVKQASDEISQIMRLRHRTKVGQDDFTIFSQEDFVATAQTITGVLTIFLGGIAAISLLVGGIGIMNIMLVSVTERTREIGLRKALGARKKDILIQFLTESSLLSLFGGVLGIVLGWLIAFIVGKIATASGTPFTPVVSLNAIVLATVFSTAVGLFFGLYPANRAAGLEPVEALRYE